MRKIFLLALTLCMLFTSCRFINRRHVQGNGNITKEQRNITGFNGVQTNGSVNIEVAPGDYNVVVESDQNIIPEIVTEVRDGSLIVRFKDDYVGFDFSTAVVHVSAPSLNVFETHGSGNITGKGQFKSNDKMSIQVAGSGNINLQINSPELETEISGSGNITLAGETKNVSASTHGSGELQAGDLKAETLKASIFGSGNTDMAVSVKLDAEIYGSGNINYKGSPQVDSRVHGSGTVSQDN